VQEFSFREQEQLVKVQSFARAPVIEADIALAAAFQYSAPNEAGGNACALDGLC